MSDAPPRPAPRATLSVPSQRLRQGRTLPRGFAHSEYVVIPLVAPLIAAALFGIFLRDRQVAGRFRLLRLARRLRHLFSVQNTLQRSAPLILTALAVAIPARIGLIMIGGEGALVLGGFASAVVAIPMP